MDALIIKNDSTGGYKRLPFQINAFHLKFIFIRVSWKKVSTNIKHHKSFKDWI